MASEYDKIAWAQFGPGIGRIFQDWGQQRARRSEFDASMAQAELRRRDAKDAADDANAIRTRTLELNEEIAADAKTRWETEQERVQEMDDLNRRSRELLGGYGRGYQSPADVGQVAGQELGGRIGRAGGFLPGVRAAVAGAAPALRKGFQEAPVTPYKSPEEYYGKAGLSKEDVGLFIGAMGGPEALEPDYVAAKQVASLYTMGVLDADSLPKDIDWNIEGLEKARTDYEAAVTAEQRSAALTDAVKQADIAYKGALSTKALAEAEDVGKDTDIDLGALFGDGGAAEETSLQALGTRYPNVDLAALSTGITEAMAQGISREALAKDLVDTYGFTDEDVALFLDSILGVNAAVEPVNPKTGAAAGGAAGTPADKQGENLARMSEAVKGLPTPPPDTTEGAGGVEAGMRTDRHENPTAFNVAVAKVWGLEEGRHYVKGDPFSGGKYHTAKLVGEYAGLEGTIKIFDEVAENPDSDIFYTKGNKPRWDYIEAIGVTMTDEEWLGLTPEEKAEIINKMYQREGGSGKGNWSNKV